MQERNYWNRLQRQRISRRRLLGSAAVVGAGAAGIALIGCGDDDGPVSTATDTPTGAEPTSTPVPSGLTPVGTRGGIYRTFGFDALSIDTLDPHQTQFGPTYNMHSAVFSKVLKYDDVIEGIISPDLAVSIPESPDGLEWVITIRDNVLFHDTPEIQSNFPAVAGRKLTAEDIKFSIERQINEDSPQRDLYYRKDQWQPIERIEVIDDQTLKIVTKVPLATFLHYLADRNSYIVAKELVDDSDEMNDSTRMVGTGPFILKEITQIQIVSCRRNPNWFAKDDNPDGVGLDRPFMDGYDALWTPQSDQVQEAALAEKEVDNTGLEDDNNTLRIEEGEPGLILGEVGISGVVGIRLLVDRPPFNDPRLRRALHLALDRRLMGEQMFPSAPGRVGFLSSGPVAWQINRWALSRAELDALPGYGTSEADREEDIAEARRLWQAGDGPSSLDGLGANIPTYIPNAGTPEMIRELADNLGLDIDVPTVGYVDLTQCLLRNQQDAPEGTCLYTFGFDNGWIDLDDWLYPFFHSGGSKNSFRLSDPTLDAMLDEQRQEFDFEARGQLGLQIQRYLLEEANDGLGVHAGIPVIAGITRNLSWSYVKNEFNPQEWFGQNYFYANMWLDQDDPNYSGRSA